jgi:hypothetical protein
MRYFIVTLGAKVTTDTKVISQTPPLSFIGIGSAVGATPGMVCFHINVSFFKDLNSHY